MPEGVHRVRPADRRPRRQGAVLRTMSDAVESTTLGSRYAKRGLRFADAALEVTRNRSERRDKTDPTPPELMIRAYALFNEE